MKKRFLPVFLLILLLFAGCRSASPVAGVWRGTWFDESLNGNVTLDLRFTEDGKVLVEGEDFSLPFSTYSVRGETLRLEGEDGARSEFDFTIRGNNLILLVESGAVYATFTRVDATA